MSPSVSSNKLLKGLNQKRKNNQMEYPLETQLSTVERLSAHGVFTLHLNSISKRNSMRLSPKATTKLNKLKQNLRIKLPC